MVLEGGAFAGCLAHEGRAFMNGVSALIKENPQSSLGPSTMWDVYDLSLEPGHASLFFHCS